MRPASREASAAAGVIVVGAINVDLVVAAPRLPAAGETVVGAGLEQHGGGKGANAAVAAARAGAAVRLVGAVGSDETGAGALAELRSEGIDVGDVAVLDGEATGVALIVVDPHGENQIAVGAGANAAVTGAHVRAALARALPGAGCVLVSTEIPGEAVVAAVESATRAGVPCVLNPAPVIDAVVGLIEAGPLLTPNAGELGDLLARLPGAGDEPHRREPQREAVARGARRIAAITGAPVIVTLGGDGALFVTPGDRAEHIPARPADVRDTTGAGDTFNGVLAACLATGDGLEPAVLAATAAASLSVTRVGARDGMPAGAAIRAALDVGF